ncbi:sugar ABC transporter substrate-binding protein [Pseudoflavonifractor phocaeensis]|uniref:sugar ABC transporter substrate-binding protein n=1 Tax=Pseudoflavonifractor phocaeensis TaxID=1870988 RepID=UPI0019599F99|nr:substrate-binding domain-containing protein [Pseudoflavonifractor phocaeensis]MBM6869972.1 substrate-binding domain-containing protein [Pseudoflavonifractor phocaeensis]
MKKRAQKGDTGFLRTGIFLLLLGAMVFLSLTLPENVFPSRDQELVEVSVLLGDWDGALWSNTRSGMDQAAEDLGAELRYLSPAQGAEEQGDMLLRELESGVDAVVIRPTDPAEVADVLTTEGSMPPVVTLESTVEGWERACVGTDAELVGRALAETVCQNHAKGSTVLLIRTGVEGSAAARRLKAAEERLVQEGFTVMTCWKPGGLDARTDELSLVRSADVLMVFDPGALEQTAQTLRTWGCGLPLYGAGSSTGIASLMEQDHITAIAAWSDYAAGYLAVERAVHTARKEGVSDSELQFQIVRKEDMYEPEIQKLLFPVSG